jgi:hypothetical protein
MEGTPTKLGSSGNDLKIAVKRFQFGNFLINFPKDPFKPLANFSIISF